MTDDERPLVILLHGLLRGKGSLHHLSRHISNQTGCECVSLGYPSATQTVLQNAVLLRKRVVELAQGRQVFAVGHSMGGIVLRFMHSLPDGGEHDGTLAVEETMLPAHQMTDFHILPVRHTFIMRNETVAQHIVSFIYTGKFGLEGIAQPRRMKES